MIMKSDIFDSPISDQWNVLTPRERMDVLNLISSKKSDIWDDIFREGQKKFQENYNIVWVPLELNVGLIRYYSTLLKWMKNKVNDGSKMLRFKRSLFRLLESNTAELTELRSRYVQTRTLDGMDFTETEKEYVREAFTLSVSFRDSIENLEKLLISLKAKFLPKWESLLYVRLGENLTQGETLIKKELEAMIAKEMKRLSKTSKEISDV